MRKEILLSHYKYWIESRSQTKQDHSTNNKLSIETYFMLHKLPNMHNSSMLENEDWNK